MLVSSLEFNRLEEGTYPGTAGQALETELLGDLGNAHCILHPSVKSLFISTMIYAPASPACWRKQGEEHHGVRLR